MINMILYLKYNINFMILKRKTPLIKNDANDTNDTNDTNGTNDTNDTL